jgi:hypothetical protein
VYRLDEGGGIDAAPFDLASTRTASVVEAFLFK